MLLMLTMRANAAVTFPIIISAEYPNIVVFMNAA